MARLMVLRHAKSDWSTGQADHERTINARGERSAALVGRHVAAAGLIPDLAITSSAVRARTTLATAAAAGAWSTDVEQTDALYNTDVTGALAVIATAPDTVSALLVVGHEPTWSALVGHLTRADVVMKTATLVVLESTARWGELDAGSCSIVSVTQARHLEGADA